MKKIGMYDVAYTARDIITNEISTEPVVLAQRHEGYMMCDPYKVRAYIQDIIWCNMPHTKSIPWWKIPALYWIGFFCWCFR